MKGAVNQTWADCDHEKQCLLCMWNSIMRDVLEDDERKVRPLGLLMLTTAGVLSMMIVYNTMYGQNNQGRANAVTASTHVEVPAPIDASNTVVFKYDATVEDVQRELLATGHFKGLVDGVNGQKTKIAIQMFQQEAGLPVNGEITSDLINHIRYTRKVKAASEFTGSINPAPEVNAVAAPQMVSQPVVAEPEAAVGAPVVPKPKKTLKKVAATIAPKPVTAKAAQNTNVITVQKALAAKGYAIGAANGKMSVATRAAILKFELDNGLPMDGVIDLPLLAALNN
jgi:peptidoglycan hydrolase-like protein with peptidoglycan-binding domain